LSGLTRIRRTVEESGATNPARGSHAANTHVLIEACAVADDAEAGLAAAAIPVSTRLWGRAPASCVRGSPKNARGTPRWRSSRAMIDELRTRFRGALLQTSDEGYDETRRIWNGTIDRRARADRTLCRRRDVAEPFPSLASATS
jgi:hypothetical protein